MLSKNGLSLKNGHSPALKMDLHLKMDFHLKWKSKYTFPWKIRTSFQFCVHILFFLYPSSCVYIRGKHPLSSTLICEYLPLAQPPHASLIRHRGLAPSNVSWHVFQYVALVDSGEKSSSTSASPPCSPTKTNAWRAPSYTSCTNISIWKQIGKFQPHSSFNPKKYSLSSTLSLPIAMQLFCVDGVFGDALLPSSQHAPLTMQLSFAGLYECGSVITGCIDWVLSSSNRPPTLLTLPS